MTYAPPALASVDFRLSSNYVAPAAGQVNFLLGDAVVPGKSRTLRVSVGAAYRTPAVRSPGEPALRWRDAQPCLRATGGSYGRALPADDMLHDGWRGSTPGDIGRATAWESAAEVPSITHASGWHGTRPLDRRPRLPWHVATPLPTVTMAGAWHPTQPADQLDLACWGDAERPGIWYDPPPEGESRPAYVPPPPNAVTYTLTAGYLAPSSSSVPFILPGPELPVDLPPYIVMRADPTPVLAGWELSTRGDHRHYVRWGHGPQLGPRDPPPYEFPHGETHEPPPVPPSQQVYIVMNDVEVLLLPDRTPIDVISANVDGSLDTWCWSMRLELARAEQLALLMPSADGPKAVQVTINGYVWVFLVEGRDKARTHASTGGRNASVTGRSQTALLSENYAAKRSYVLPDNRSAQQLALGEITDRAYPFGITWSGVDWIVPAAAWSYQDLAPIEAIAQIAAARGAVVLSSPADARLIVTPRYPTSPWTWTPETADIALPLDWVGSESAQLQSKPMYDAVFVMGQQQGVMARVTRKGSAGETWAPQVVDPLIVTAEVAAERGRNVLSDRGMQEMITHEIPLFPAGPVTGGASGLYLPSLVVDVIDPDDRYQALCAAVSISARPGDDGYGLQVWQTVSLERHLSDAH